LRDSGVHREKDAIEASTGQKMINFPRMNFNLEAGPRHESPQESIDWKDLRTPLRLVTADEFGAVFKEVGANTRWYLDLNEMHFRPAQDSDASEDRREHAQRYTPAEHLFATGTAAAMHIREHYLEDQIRVLSISKDVIIKEMAEDLQDELDLVHAYISESNPKEREQIARELDEIYREMREDEPGERSAAAA
jgi:hypothetical protein